jgi:phosphatidylserine synthase
MKKAYYIGIINFLTAIVVAFFLGFAFLLSDNGEIAATKAAFYVNIFLSFIVLSNTLLAYLLISGKSTKSQVQGAIIAISFPAWIVLFFSTAIVTSNQIWLPFIGLVLLAYFYWRQFRQNRLFSILLVIFTFFIFIGGYLANTGIDLITRGVN